MCNRLSGYSGYSDIRKNLSVRIASLHYSEKSISEFYLFEITGLCFSIRRSIGIRRQHRQFAHYSNTVLS